jgi:glycosyltransferase involved in cell wall biosynthesis
MGAAGRTGSDDGRLMTDPARPAPRIAYLTGEYPAVSHTFILREVEALRARGLDVITCSVRRTGPEHHRGPPEKEAARTTFYVLPATALPIALIRAKLAALKTPGRFLGAFRLALRTSPPGPRALLWQMFYFAEALVLARHLKEQGVTHLHNHFGNSSCSVAMLTSAVSGIPFSYTMHGPAIFFEPRLWRIDEKIARAKFVACISNFCRSQGMIFADSAHWGKMRIVHCGIDPARYGTTPRGAPGKRLVFVGRLAAVKGVPVLLEAFAKVLAAHPDARLTLVGDGPERPKIEARAGELGLGETVRFAGYLSQDEVTEELARSDLFVLPSFAEGVPVVLMEAMASRLAVVATRIAGIPELVEDGVAGRLVPPGDADALAAAISGLLADPEGRARMAEAGRARVESEFDLAREAEKLAALFKSVGPTGLPDQMRRDERRD